MTATETQAHPSDSNETNAPACMPRSDFVAAIAARWSGNLYACSRLWDGYALECPVLESTPLKEAQWAPLHAYMQRRFGLGHIGADDYKDLGAGWMLTTPDPSVFIHVCPSLSGPGFSFTPRCADPEVGEFIMRGAKEVPPERIEAIKEAYRATLLDLLRPVCVRDVSINALGEVDEDDPLLHYDEETDESVYEAKRHPSSGYAMPVGLYGGKDWGVLCGLISSMGGGDMEAGRRAAIERLQAPVLVEVAGAPWAVQRLVLLASDDADGLAKRMGLSADAIATFKAERAAFAQERLPSLVDEMTDEAMGEAAGFLARLGLDGDDLPAIVEPLRIRKAVEDAWAELVVLADDDFPETALPDDPWRLGAEMPSVFKAGLRDHGREDLVGWVDRTVARAGGAHALQQIVCHLAHRVESGTGHQEPG